MKLLTLITLLLTINIASAQNANAIFKAIGKSDISALSANFSDDIEICIGTDQDFYSKSEAAEKLKSFFGQVKPSAGSFLHEGSSKDNSSKYSVGTMNSSKGKYRVFVYYKEKKITGFLFNKE